MLVYQISQKHKLLGGGPLIVLYSNKEEEEEEEKDLLAKDPAYTPHATPNLG